MTLNLAALIRQNRPKDGAWPGLILEVPEGEVVNDVGLIHEIATQLRIYGITLAIDDFGEGYSSFARLRELPFGELKLDRGFVDGCAGDARNAGICRAIIELAHQFGVAAVAEGLEDVADIRAIRDMGCDVGQGYYFARPMPKVEIHSAARRRERPRADNGSHERSTACASRPRERAPRRHVLEAAAPGAAHNGHAADSAQRSKPRAPSTSGCSRRRSTSS